MVDKEPADSSEDKPAEATEEEKHEEHSEPEEETGKDGRGPIKRFFHGFWAKKKITLPFTFLLIVIVVLAVPMSRYKVLGLIIKRNFSVTVLDSQTGRPISEAEVSLDGRSIRTSSEGKATVKQVSVGNKTLTITKEYYQGSSRDVLVGLDEIRNNKEVKLKATGRAVLIKVTNKISGEALSGVSIAALGTEATTDDKGEATIVLPADESKAKATLKAEGYNGLDEEIAITGQQTDKNNFALTPSGKVYFLSKRSGAIDVVKSNLDGSARETVLAGTGREQESDTVLLATRDWKYLALKSRRDSDKAKLYLINTSTDKLTVMDEGDAEFDVYGWQDHDFVYLVTRNKETWEPRRLALKSFNAENRKLTTMRESKALGGQNNYAAEVFEGVYALLEDHVMYAVRWSGCCSTVGNDQNHQIIRGQAGSTKTTVLKSFPVAKYSGIDSKLYEPDEIYYAVYRFDSEGWEFYEYEDGQVGSADTDQDTFFNKSYPRYIESPSGNVLFWSESRDGKNVLFIGDRNGENEKEIAALNDFATYGWFTDSYLLVSKEDSELYIMANKKDAEPFKVTDYHKPNFNYNGYGGGY